MTLTRANVEFLTVGETSPLLVAAGMAVTVAGSNADLNGSIGRAILDLGYSVISMVSISDTDVAQITDAQMGEFLDCVLLHALESILGHLDDVDITVGPRSEQLSQLAAQVERRIARLRDEYGIGLATPVAGYITKDIAEHD